MACRARAAARKIREAHPSASGLPPAVECGGSAKHSSPRAHAVGAARLPSSPRVVHAREDGKFAITRAIERRRAPSANFIRGPGAEDAAKFVEALSHLRLGCWALMMVGFLGESGLVLRLEVLSYLWNKGMLDSMKIIKYEVRR